MIFKQDQRMEKAVMYSLETKTSCILVARAIQNISTSAQMSELIYRCVFFGKSKNGFLISDHGILLSTCIYMFQHSANSLFDLWLFLLRWPHTPQALLETSLPSRPLLLERTGQPQHWGLYPLPFSNCAWVL